MTFNGFAAYVIDAGGAWSTSGAETLAAGQSLTVIGGLGGAGTIGGAGKVVNQASGVIDADSAGQMVIDTGKTAVVNLGLIEATGAGGLALRSAVLNQAGGGGLSAATGSEVGLQGVHVIGGSLTTAGTGVISMAGTGGALDGLAHALANKGQLTIDDGALVTIEGQVTNSGAMELASAGHSTGLVVGAAGASLGGKGQVTLGGSGELARIYGFSSSAVLTNLDNTITGTGMIGLGRMTLVNKASGVIDADAAGGLTLDTAGKALTNAGTIGASGAGQLTIVKTTLDQSGGGTILAAGAKVVLQTADVMGGTLASTGAGTIIENVSGGVLDGTGGHPVTLAGSLSMIDKTSMTIIGSIVNAGTLAMNGAADLTDLAIGSAGATLSGGGLVRMTSQTTNHIDSAVAAALTNVDNTISGAGTVGNANLTLVNGAKGVIVSTGAALLTLDTGVHTITNAGTIQARAGGGVTVDSAIANTGVLFAGGGTLDSRRAGDGDRDRPDQWRHARCGRRLQ